MTRPTSPHQASRQHLQCSRIEHLTISQPIQPAIDAPGDGFKRAFISQGVVVSGGPKPRRRHARVLWLFQQFGLVDQIKAQRFAAGFVVAAAGDMNQATAAIFGAVPRLSVAEVDPALLSSLRGGWAPDFSHVFELI